MIKKITTILKERGLAGLFSAIYLRFFPIRAKAFQTYNELLKNKIGIEIGGPSHVFSPRGIFPVYSIISSLDNCNYGDKTVWEGAIEAGHSFRFNSKKPAGQQYIVEATSMSCIPSSSYDVVLSSHALEHTANPIQALSELIRLLKDQGVLVLLLPHKDGTFDHRRPVTTMEHLISDFDAKRGEDDLTHMSEILALHDLERDPEAGDKEAFRERSMRNFENRCFHHHVFDTRLAVEFVDYLGLKILAVEAIEPTHILIIAQKKKIGMEVNNTSFTDKSAQYHLASPFPSDRLSTQESIA